jgi:hypothetical protein
MWTQLAPIQSVALKDTILEHNLFCSSGAKKECFNPRNDSPPQLVNESLTLIKNLRGEVVG